MLNNSQKTIEEMQKTIEERVQNGLGSVSDNVQREMEDIFDRLGDLRERFAAKPFYRLRTFLPITSCNSPLVSPRRSFRAGLLEGWKAHETRCRILSSCGVWVPPAACC